MISVVDASVVVAYLLGEADDLERRAVHAGAHAPELVTVEVTQALRGLLRAGKIGSATAVAARRDLADLSVRRFGGTPLVDRAWELRDVCTIFDGLYVALSEGLGVPLLTRDRRLIRSLSGADTLCEAIATG